MGGTGAGGGVCACFSTGMEVRERPAGVCFLFPPGGSWISNSSHQDRQQVSLSAEPSHNQKGTGKKNGIISSLGQETQQRQVTAEDCDLMSLGNCSVPAVETALV